MLIGGDGRILVDIIGDFYGQKGEFSWILLVTSSGHFCSREFLFWGEFCGHFLGEF